MCITYTQTELLRADNYFILPPIFCGKGLIREGFVFYFCTSWSLHLPPPLHCLTGRRGRNTTAYGTENSSDSRPLSHTVEKSDLYQGKQCLQEIFLSNAKPEAFMSFDKANSWPSDLFNSKSVQSQDFCLISWECTLSLVLLTAQIFHVSIFTSGKEIPHCTIFCVCSLHRNKTIPQSG